MLIAVYNTQNIQILSTRTQKVVVFMFQFGLAKTVSQHFTKGSVSKIHCKSGDHRTVKTY